MVKYFTALLLLAALPLAAVELTETAAGQWLVKFPGGQATVANPNRPEERGTRFSRGGWVDSLRDRQGRELLAQTAIFPWHPAWGMPLEFQISPELGKSAARGSLRLRPGVGVVELIDRDVLREAFPWKTEVLREGERLRLRFLQEGRSGPYAYQLAIELSFGNEAFFTVAVQLKNQGSVELRVESALHPFLEPAVNFDSTFISLPSNVKDPHLFRLTELPFRLAFQRREPGWMSARNLKSGGTLLVKSTPAADEWVFWRSHDTANFAIEPVMKRLIPPGETAGWSFEIHL